mgnify:CR=1 FL=1
MGSPEPEAYSSSMRELVVFLHDVGQLPPVWQPQVEALPADLPMSAPWLAGLRPGNRGEFSPTAAAQDISNLLTERGTDRGYLIAHGFSTIVAALAAAQDDRVAGLILISPRIPPTRRQIRGIKLMMRFIPRSQAIDKRRFGEVLDTLSSIDLPQTLQKISAPAMLIGVDGDQASQDGVGTYLKHLRIAAGKSVAAQPANDGIPEAATAPIAEMLETWRNNPSSTEADGDRNPDPDA